ncbi:MAG: CDP-alcohol phosphatidyltransferase family protein [FCB group bacterium]|nr:CDP-alcohol phosphatidyltransferase family protein [FCB group bacterium]
MSRPEKIKITDPTRVLTLANMVSLLRAFMAVPIVYAIAGKAHWSIILGLILLAVASDALDGYFARRAHEVTHLGKWLDPIADFIVVITVVFHMVLNGMFPLWFFLFYLFRILSIALPAIYLINHTSLILSANLWGKWFIGFTALSVASYIFHYDGITLLHIPLLIITLALGIISWLIYFRTLVQEFRNLP